jgi:mono/diheme cytochrome c family protein
MTATALRWGLLLSVILATATCGSARRGEPLVGPIAMRTPAEARGEQLFMANCSSCHPKGETGLGPAINDKPLPAFLIKTQVRVGFGAMPAFSHAEIGPHELDDIVAYLKAIR